MQRRGQRFEIAGLDIAGGGCGDPVGTLWRRHGRDARILRGHARVSAADAAATSCGRLQAVNGRKPVPDHLLGTSGTVTTIAGVQLGLRRYDRSRVDGCWLDSEDIGEVTGDLLRHDL